MRVAGPARVVRHYGSVALPAAHETAWQYVGLGSGAVAAQVLAKVGVLGKSQFGQLGFFGATAGLAI